MSFNELGLPDETIFVYILRLRGFVCSKCGSRNVKVMPIFSAARGTLGYSRKCYPRRPTFYRPNVTRSRVTDPNRLS
jgi:hypothetical protein